jgi:YidC/Oxa1 family membrane protein insertase
MGVTQIAIQRMTPQTTVDPVQAKIMQFMPIMFTFILAWAPAGLVLYWFSNNLVSMVQQVVTNRWLGKGEGEGGPQGEKAKKAAKQAQAHG